MHTGQASIAAAGNTKQLRIDDFTSGRAMSNAYRFGRRISLPSTRQITHELRQMIAAGRIKALELELAGLKDAASAKLTAANPPVRS